MMCDKAYWDIRSLYPQPVRSVTVDDKKEEAKPNDKG
jgi:hypothetical protein